MVELRGKTEPQKKVGFGSKTSAIVISQGCYCHLVGVGIIALINTGWVRFGFGFQELVNFRFPVRFGSVPRDII